ncbi:LAMI_0A04060g1_1 [Lachancea mirantina]|uniref:LAMI_0A04060g1_1 n=1 Tax=Lachancea mirantina TaxID=1230905 RepID=A0A1G4IP38_9SACH|nr:LAMI_0A04060g1_1 [Lachancea mirantina]
MEGKVDIEMTSDSLGKINDSTETIQNDASKDFEALEAFGIKFLGNLEINFKESKKRRLELSQTAEELRKQARPLEFESYEDFYLLQKFRRGISASGRVGVNALRSRRSGVYYKRIRRNNGSENNVSDSDSDSDDKDFQPLRRSGRAQRGRPSAKSRASSSEENLTTIDRESTPVNKILGEISTSSIIPSGNLDGNVRRSSRLSQKEKELLEQKAEEELLKLHSGEDDSEEKLPEIMALSESIIPKIVEPSRRSDWVLQTKYRFIPEKFTPVKHSPEQLKINDLIHNDRIRKVMTRFKGGLAGIRRKDWGPSQQQPQPLQQQVS